MPTLNLTAIYKILKKCIENFRKIAELHTDIWKFKIESQEDKDDQIFFNVSIEVKYMGIPKWLNNEKLLLFGNLHRTYFDADLGRFHIFILSLQDLNFRQDTEHTERLFIKFHIFQTFSILYANGI